jgi:hypothetical protein
MVVVSFFAACSILISPNPSLIDDLPENIAAAKQCGIDAVLFESVEQIQMELNDRGL